MSRQLRKRSGQASISEIVQTINLWMVMLKHYLQIFFLVKFLFPIQYFLLSNTLTTPSSSKVHKVHCTYFHEEKKNSMKKLEGSECTMQEVDDYIWGFHHYTIHLTISCSSSPTTPSHPPPPFSSSTPPLPSLHLTSASQRHTRSGDRSSSPARQLYS